jgi:hypothetical protein
MKRKKISLEKISERYWSPEHEVTEKEARNLVALA